VRKSQQLEQRSFWSEQELLYSVPGVSSGSRTRLQVNRTALRVLVSRPENGQSVAARDEPCHAIGIAQAKLDWDRLKTDAFLVCAIVIIIEPGLRGRGLSSAAEAAKPSPNLGRSFHRLLPSSVTRPHHPLSFQRPPTLVAPKLLSLELLPCSSRRPKTSQTPHLRRLFLPISSPHYLLCVLS
jgi:hypothetical protein